MVGIVFTFTMNFFSLVSVYLHLACVDVHCSMVFYFALTSIAATVAPISHNPQVSVSVCFFSLLQFYSLYRFQYTRKNVRTCPCPGIFITSSLFYYPFYLVRSVSTKRKHFYLLYWIVVSALTPNDFLCC